MDSRRETRHLLILIILLLVFHGITNYEVLRRSNNLRPPDSATYFVETVRLTRTMTHIRSGGIKMAHCLQRLIKIVHCLQRLWKPPLAYLMAVPFVALAHSYTAVVMSNLASLGILIFGTYGIGKALYGHEIGLFSAFLVTLLPIVFAHSRVFYLDLSLAAWVALSFSCFAKDRFDEWRHALGAGLVMGAGMLAKQGFFLYLILMVCYFFLRRGDRSGWRRTRGLGIALAIAFALAAPWYLAGSPAQWAKSHASYYIDSIVGIHKGPDYLTGLLFRHLLPVFFLMFIAACLDLIRRREFSLPTMVFAAIAAFSVSPNRADRFILPIFSIVAVILAAWSWSWQPRLRGWLIPLLSLFSVGQCLAVSHIRVATWPESQDHSRLVQCILSKTEYMNTGLLSVAQADADSRGLARRFASDILRDAGRGSFGLAWWPEGFSYEVLFELAAQNQAWRVFRFLPDSSSDSDMLAWCHRSIPEVDFLMLEGGPDLFQDQTETRRCLDAASRRFMLLRSAELPGGHFIRLYRNRRQKPVRG